jgi:hypothetical protein
MHQLGPQHDDLHAEIAAELAALAEAADPPVPD